MFLLYLLSFTKILQMKQTEKTACKQPVRSWANSQAFDEKCDSVLFPNAVKVGGFITMPGRKKV